ncbi:spermidine synthase [gamma proteobacterium HTCC5015]|nr:spermidine synthase [gamma proteobacterium HTCC5015]
MSHESPLRQPHWYTEEYAEGGSAFSLHIHEKIHEEQSEFQTIAIYDTLTFGKLMTIDGLVMLTSRDNFIYHEMMTHPVLFNHSHPQDVLIVGGGDCGSLQQVLKHRSVRRAVQVDIDERVTRLSEKHFPELCCDNSDPRADLQFADAIRWIADAADESLDIIIVDSTDPIGPAEGLFGPSFYSDCLRALRPGGMVCQQSESPLYHLDSIIKPMHQAMRDSGFQDSKSLHFSQPTYPSGWWTATLARKGANIECPSQAEIEARQDFETRYYNPAGHGGYFALPPMMGL